jgi:zinc protease
MPQKTVTIEGITEYRLNNGVGVLLFPDSSSSKVTVNLTVFVGSRHEGYGETGMAHLLEHLVFKGTPTHPNVPKALKDRGAVFNGTTWVDRTNYYETLNASDANLEFALKLEADRLVNSFIRRDDLVSEMTVVRNEFESGENDPRRVLGQRMMATAYEWHNYGKSTIGNRSDIERVPIENLRAFYKKYYRPDNVMVIVAGNFKEEKALELIGKSFGVLPKPESPLDETYTEEPPQDGERTVTLRRVGTVGLVGTAYHIPSGAHPDFAALDVLTTMLTMEPAGRLYQELVAGLKAASVTATAYGWHDPGVLQVMVQVNQGQPVEAVRDALVSALEKLRTETFTQAEVERAKLKLDKARELLLADSNRIGIVLSDWASRGDWRLFFLHRQRLAQVTPDDVSRVARHYLQRNNRTVGLYIPTDLPQRSTIPATPDLAQMIKEYRPVQDIAAGEFFDPTVENIEKRVKRRELAGGVKSALLPRKTRGEVVYLSLILHYGNEESLKGHTSATQLLARLMERGTQKHSRQEIEDTLDRLKARLRSGGVLGDVNFVVECKKESLPGVLDLVGEVLRQPSFPAAEFDILKRQFRDGLERMRSDPRSLAGRALERKLNPFPSEHIRYVPTIEESIARLEAVTLDEVKALYTEQLGGQAGELVIVGDFDPEPIVKQTEAILKDWVAKTPYRRIERPAVKGVNGERLTVETPDKANAVYQAGLMLSLSDADPDVPALEVANFLFGSGALSSRLGNRVRQKEGLSYGVSSRFAADARDPSSQFSISAIYNPDRKDRIDTVIAEEVEKMLREGVEARELDEAKKAFLQNLKVRRGSDIFLAGLLQENLQAGRTMKYYAELEQKVADLTPEQVSAIFRKHIDPRKLVIIQAGDFRKKN